MNNSLNNVHQDGSFRFKPSEDGFFLYKFLGRLFVVFIGAGVLFLALYWGMSFPAISILIFIAALFFITCLIYYFLLVKYRKEEYVFEKDKLIRKGGTVFSDSENELVVKNITRVSMVLPFIEYKLFKTGYIKVESAGSLATEIFIRSVKNPQEIYSRVIGLMQENGFKLTCKNIVQEERPHSLAVFFEVFHNFIWALAGLAYIVLNMLDDKKIDYGKLFSENGIEIMLAAGVVLLGLLGYAFINFLNLKMRFYHLYEDAVQYTEGFLKKVVSIIPIENLSDSSVTQSFISKKFGLYDVKLSCQGNASEILFKNIKNGEKLSENIDRLIDKEKGAAEVQQADFPEVRKVHEASVKRKLAYDRDFTAEHRMKAFRTWLPVIIFSPLLILLFPLGIIIVIARYIRLVGNVFRIKPDSIEHTFNLFNRRTKEFSLEKITGIIFTRGISDRICNTCSVLFWSIGSGDNITFSNIAMNDEFKAGLLSKKGIHHQETLNVLEPAFTVLEFLKRNFYVNLFITLPVIAALIFIIDVSGFIPLAAFILFLFIIMIYKSVYYKHMSIVFYEDYIHFSEGLVIKKDSYFLYDDIKGIATVKYPFSLKGDIRFNVAGETVVKSQRGQAIRRKNNAASIRYVGDVNVLDELIDTIFYKRPTVKEIQDMLPVITDTSFSAVHAAKPSLANSFIVAVFVLGLFDIGLLWPFYFLNNAVPVEAIVGVFLFDFLVFVIIASVKKATSYQVQTYRVLERSGIIFKKQISVIFDKIDYINFSRGFLNKICGNGNITINTAGSSKPELVMRDIKGFKQFYEILKESYNRFK